MLLTALSASAALSAGEVCVDAKASDMEGRLRFGWCQYRQGKFAEARATFVGMLAFAPADVDARIGLAYATLQAGNAEAALGLFEAALAARPADADAQKGLKLALERTAYLNGETRRRPDASPDTPLVVNARALVDTIEIRGADGTWKPVFLKGVNLGAALPGKYPTEFPTEDATWRSWLKTIADLGANCVRTYTLLPPSFYSALAAHNAAAPKKLWLVQGVWTELPDRHDFSDPVWVASFGAEIARVIDAVHGDLVLPPRPGHAAGIYTTDVSEHLLATIVGREWEPFAVVDYDAMKPGPCEWKGAWFETSGGRAMECFVTRMLDFAAAYEARRYRALHPLTFANWPTLDPLTHPTEANRAEEDAWRKKLGIPYPEVLKEQPWDNDAIALDATLVRPTSAMTAGFFAAYHVYPNYPDFINNEPSYAPNRYESYLKQLKARHGRQPVVIAEFGMSTSRGLAHVQPEGWHHGGMDEREAMRINASMLRSIHGTGYAGGIVFAYQDEWFKGTWSVAPFQIPADRRRLWFNAESPEPSYGLIANRPKAPVRVDGDPSDWPQGKGIGILHDEGYLYLLLRGPDAASRSWRIGIDTYDPKRGERTLPDLPGVTTPTGVEFVVTLEPGGPGRMLVSAPYDREARRDAGPFASPEKPSGTWAPMMFEANRERFGRDGTRFPAIRVERGALRLGSLDPASPAFDTRTDVAVGQTSGAVELRLPWGLLNVTDPSSYRVLHQTTKHDGVFDTTATDGIRVYAYARDPEDGKVVRRLERKAPYAWPSWEQPRYVTEPKAGLEALREAMETVDAR